MLTISACDSPDETPAAEPAHVLPGDQFQAILDRQVADGVPGIVLRVETKDGEVWSGAAGVTALDGPAMTSTTRMPIFSVSKMAVATAALSLVDDGTLRLEDPISQWLDPVTISDLPNADRLTVRHLINQTGGVRDYWDDEFTEAVIADTTKQWRPEELVAHAAEGAPAGSPDDGDADYSNTNYVLLGLIIEKATGSPLARRPSSSSFRAPQDEPDRLLGGRDPPAGSRWIPAGWRRARRCHRRRPLGFLGGGGTYFDRRGCCHPHESSGSRWRRPIRRHSLLRDDDIHTPLGGRARLRTSASCGSQRSATPCLDTWAMAPAMPRSPCMTRPRASVSSSCTTWHRKKYDKETYLEVMEALGLYGENEDAS